MSGVTRMNVSIPRALKAEMDALESPPNWSAVASAAFRAAVLEAKATMSSPVTLEEAAARLRATEELEGKEAHERGRAAGRRWALCGASARQLRRLDKLERRHGLGMGHVIAGYAGGVNGHIAR